MHVLRNRRIIRSSKNLWFMRYFWLSYAIKHYTLNTFHLFGDTIYFSKFMRQKYHLFHCFNVNYFNRLLCLRIRIILLKNHNLIFYIQYYICQVSSTHVTNRFCQSLRVVNECDVKFHAVPRFVIFVF